MARVVLELYGIARRRAGRESVAVDAKTLGEALAALERAHPALSGEVVAAGRLAPHWRASVEGQAFVEAPETPLAPGARVLLLSALAGG
jgi:molybdopterin converting factor small subunit